MKKDKFFKTGEATEQTALNVDSGGNACAGLPEESFGSFSMGKWLFQFYAYTVGDAATDNTSEDALTVTVDGTTYELTLYLSGDNFGGEAYYTTLNSSNNTVDANVALVDAQADYGNIYVYGVYIQDENGNTLSILDSEDDATEDDVYYIIKDKGTYAVVTLYSGNTAVRTIEDIELAVVTDTGLYISYTNSTVDDDTTKDDATIYLVPTGYYTIQVDLYDKDIDEEAPIGSATLENVLVRASLTTTVYGSTDEDTLDVKEGLLPRQLRL